MSNLKPFKKGDKRTVEAGRKGGSTITILSSMKARKYCNKTCKYIERCPYFELSQREKGKKKPCLFKQANPETQRRVVDILIKGTPEALKEYKRVIVKMGEAFDNTKSMKEMSIYGDMIQSLHEMMFGKKMHQKITAEVKTEVTIEEFKKARKEMRG